MQARTAPGRPATPAPLAQERTMKTCLALSTIATIVIFCATTPAILAQGSSEARAASAAATAASATSVPRLVQFNGTLKDASARPVSGADERDVCDLCGAGWRECSVERDGERARGCERPLQRAARHGDERADFRRSYLARLRRRSRWLGVTVARAAGDAARVAGECAVCDEGGRCGYARRIAGVGVCDGDGACGARRGGCAGDHRVAAGGASLGKRGADRRQLTRAAHAIGNAGDDHGHGDGAIFAAVDVRARTSAFRKFIRRVADSSGSIRTRRCCSST